MEISASVQSLKPSAAVNPSSGFRVPAASATVNGPANPNTMIMDLSGQSLSDSSRGTAAAQGCVSRLAMSFGGTFGDGGDDSSRCPPGDRVAGEGRNVLFSSNSGTTKTNKELETGGQGQRRYVETMGASTISNKYSGSLKGDVATQDGLRRMTAPWAVPPVAKYAVSGKGSNALGQSCQKSVCQIMKPPQATAPRSSQAAPALMSSLKSAAGAGQGKLRAPDQVSPRSGSKNSSCGKANGLIEVVAKAAPPPAQKSASATGGPAGSYGLVHGNGLNPALVAVGTAAAIPTCSSSITSNTPFTTSTSSTSAAAAARASPAAAGSRMAAVNKPASGQDNSAMDTADNATRTDKADGAAGEHDSMNNNLAAGNPVPEFSPSAASDTGAEGGGDVGGGPIRNLRVRGQRKFLPEKTRHKRQTLQDMTRPLKQWLLRHRDNPYPSKAEKMELVSASQMTLTQVSNWFANARRRLKNTVKQPDLTWASRIKLYNSCVQGNAELFSICSDDSCPDSDDDMMEQRQCDTFHDDVTDSLTSSRTTTPDVTAGGVEGCGNFNHGSNSVSSSGSSSSNVSHHHHHHHHSYHHSHCPATSSSSNSSSSGGSAPSGSGPPAPSYPAGLEDGCGSFHKYKHSILHRYLSDAHQQALILDEDSVSKTRDRHHSSSTGSRDFEELSTSSVSSPAHESVHHDHLDDFSEEFETMALMRKSSDLNSAPVAEEEEMYWKEIGAALALTSLARGRAVSTTT